MAAMRWQTHSEGFLGMAQLHWNTVVLDGSVPDSLLRQMIEDSYDLVVAGHVGAEGRAG